MAIPSRVADRLSQGLKRFQPILEAARTRDVNESDTSMIVTDLIAEMFGYDKYNEITREMCIRGTYCDLATKLDGKIQMIVEVKAIGVDLRDAHTKQAVDYAANQGIEWVAVTNGSHWKVYRVVFAKPIGQELVLEIDILSLARRNAAHIEDLYLLTRESVVKSGLNTYHDHQQATSKFFLAGVILSDPVLEVIRRELRRVSGGDVKVDIDEIRAAVTTEVLKREVIEGDKFELARKKVARSAGKMLRVKKEVIADGISAAPMVVPTETDRREGAPGPRGTEVLE